MKKILYKLDSTGNIRFIEFFVKEDTLFSKTGILDTNNPIIHKKVCVGKNIGKSNETSPKEQAILELLSKFKIKKSEGYFEDIEHVQNTEVILPMLAKDYNKEKHKIDWTNCYCQPKFDGCRALAFIKNGNVTLLSRNGKEFTTVPHIVESLSKIKENCILDGELYIHGVSFQENMTAIKKYQKGLTEKVQFRVYDLVSDDSYINRLDKVDKYTEGIDNVKVTITFKIEKEQDLKEYHTVFLQEGYEGTMIRHGEKGYQVKVRSSYLLKYKDFSDIALPIIDIIPSQVKPTWGIPVFKIGDKTFKTGTRISYAEREDLLLNKSNYIGKTAEIRYFEFTNDGIPRFGIMTGIRIDK